MGRLLCIALMVAVATSCVHKHKSDNTTFLLLAALALNTGAPRYEFQESTVYPSTANANYYGAGLTGYSTTAYSNLIGPTYPSAIVEAEQDHSVASTYIDFQQNISAWGYQFSRNAPTGTRLGSIQHFYGSQTTNFFSGGAIGNFSFNQANTFALIVPSNSLPVKLRTVRALIPASAEENSFVADTSTANYKLRGMSKSWATEKRLNVNLIFLSGANPSASAAGIQGAIDRMTQLYTQQTVRIRPVIMTTTISLPGYLNLTSLSQDVTTTGSLGGLFVDSASAQRPDALNIIFVKSETAVGGVLGISGGIPGLPGKTGTRQSAMAVIMDSHLATPGTSPSASEQKLMGETMAHEGGHWLGLWHTVESSYNTTQNIWTRDAIAETGFCTATPVNLANCDFTGSTNTGARNVMFWAGTAGFDQPDLTGEQGWVLRRHPLAY